MNITIEHFDGKWPSFNVCLSSAEGKEPFLVIKGCRIVEGKKGKFVSGPSRKKDDGTYQNFTYFSDGFAAAVIKEAEKAPPKKQQSPVDEDSIPF